MNKFKFYILIAGGVSVFSMAIKAGGSQVQHISEGSKTSKIVSENKKNLKLIDSLESSGWIKTQRKDGGATTYLHSSSVPKSKELSYFSVYPVGLESKEIIALFDDIKSKKENKIQNLSPANCYLLIRNDLESKQTWCEKTKDVAVVTVEEGPEKMRENLKSEIIFEAVFGTIHE